MALMSDPIYEGMGKRQEINPESHTTKWPRLSLWSWRWLLCCVSIGGGGGGFCSSGICKGLSVNEVVISTGTKRCTVVKGMVGHLFSQEGC